MGQPRVGMPLPNAENQASYPGWRVLLASVIGLAFSPGPMVFGSMGLFAPHLNEAFGWGRGQIMLSLTIFNFAGVLAAPYTGKLLDRFGVRRVLLPCQLAFVAGWVAVAGFARSLEILYIIAACWGALTVGTQSISYSKLICGWFSLHRGLAIGITSSGVGIGFFIVPLIIAELLSVMSWQMVCLTMGCLVLALPLLLNFWLIRPNPLAAELARAETGMTASEVRRSPALYIMGAAIMLAAVALAGVVPHVALLAMDRGFDAGKAAVVAAVYGVSTIIGRVVVGWLADHFSVSRIAAAFFLSSSFGFLVIAFVASDASFALLLSLAFMIGMGYGAENDVIALLIAKHFGQRSFGTAYGILLAVFLLGASIGAPLFGYGFEIYGSYEIPMLSAAVVMLGSALLMLALRSPTGRTPIPMGYVPARGTQS